MPGRGESELLARAAGPERAAGGVRSTTVGNEGPTAARGRNPSGPIGACTSTSAETPRPSKCG